MTGWACTSLDQPGISPRSAWSGRARLKFDILNLDNLCMAATQSAACCYTEAFSTLLLHHCFLVSITTLIGRSTYFWCWLFSHWLCRSCILKLTNGSWTVNFMSWSTLTFASSLLDQWHNVELISFGLRNHCALESKGAPNLLRTCWEFKSTSAWPDFKLKLKSRK